MSGLTEILRSLFSFLSTPSMREERATAYLLREHARGRRASEIVEDPYVRNRLSPAQRARMLERAEVIHALSEQDLQEAHAMLATKPS